MRGKMKIICKVGQWLTITFILLSLTGSIPSDRPGRPEDAQVATLVHLARTNLQARLGIGAEMIALESTRPLIFACPAPDTCQHSQPGYIIRLAVDNVVYGYNARVLGKQVILWHEAEIGQPLDGEAKKEGQDASRAEANEK
jgi:hypothetical protein